MIRRMGSESSGMVEISRLAEVLGEPEHIILMAIHDLQIPVFISVDSFRSIEEIRLSVEIFKQRKKERFSRGGRARAQKLTPEERSSIASKASRARWDSR